MSSAWRTSPSATNDITCAYCTTDTECDAAVEVNVPFHPPGGFGLDLAEPLAAMPARGEAKSLPGFDENSYGQAGDFDRRSIRDLADDFDAARRSTIAMLRGIPDAAWGRRGVANEVPVNVVGLAYITLGHERHHLRVLHDRYGV